MTEYFLPHHVYVGCRGETLVFLDLEQDDYYLVDGDAAAAFQTLSSRRNGTGRTLESDLGELLDSGLLTTDGDAGRRIALTKTELALERLIDPDDPSRAQITAGHLWNFIAACTIAAARLRWTSLGNIARTAIERKKSCLNPADLERTRHLTSVFHRLRYFFPRNYLCLYDSLALLEFLARYQIFPTWIFGIRLEPWAAHCWVQEAGFTFNEGVEEAAAYTPVMAI